MVYTAKTYKDWERIGEPYTVNNKKYILVKNPANNSSKQVRVYSETEYRHMYPLDVIPSNPLNPQKNALGFQKGYITIFKGDVESVETFFKQSNARYCVYWGWYIVSTEEIPENLPKVVKPIRLDWDKVGNEDGTLLPKDKVEEVISKLLYEESSSQFIGKIGDRIEITVTIDKNIPFETEFGHSFMHIMHDEDQNEYVWFTASQDWPVGSVKTIRGTIKEHKIFRNVRQNILNRCIERK